MRISKTVTGSFFISSNSGLFSTAVPEIFPVTRCYNLKIRIHFIILTDFHQADNLRSYINTIQNRTFRSVISKNITGLCKINFILILQQIIFSCFQKLSIYRSPISGVQICQIICPLLFRILAWILLTVGILITASAAVSSFPITVISFST